MTTSNPTVDFLLSWADNQPHPVACEKCGRPLTDDASKARGVGPICLHKIEEMENEDD